MIIEIELEGHMSMKPDQVQHLMEEFERHKRSHLGAEVWSARDLMALFGYKSWQKFRNLLFRAMNAMETAGADPDTHFYHVDELPRVNTGEKRARENFYMSRAGAYMLALETDTKEYEAAAFARAYFSTQTRFAELTQIQSAIEAEERDLERLDARSKLSAEERGFQEVLWQAGIKGTGIARIREEGNKALFGGFSTEDIRWRLGIGGTKRTPSDFLPTPVVLAKALIASLTQQKVVEEGQRGELRVAATHIQHNKHVRTALLESGVYPEKSEALEDIRIVEKRLNARKKISSRSESIPAISIGDQKIIGVRDPYQSAEHQALFNLEEF